MDFTGKKILFFSAQAFGIPENIVSSILKKGEKWIILMSARPTIL